MLWSGLHIMFLVNIYETVVCCSHYWGSGTIITIWCVIYFYNAEDLSPYPPGCLGEKGQVSGVAHHQSFYWKLSDVKKRQTQCMLLIRLKYLIQWDLNCKEVQSTKPNSVNRQSWNVKVEVERWKIWRESRDMEYFVLHPSQFHFSQSISFMGSVDSLLEIAAIRYNSDLFSCSQSKTGRGLVVVFIYSILSILGLNT